MRKQIYSETESNSHAFFDFVNFHSYMNEYRGAELIAAIPKVDTILPDVHSNQRLIYHIHPFGVTLDYYKNKKRISVELIGTKEKISRLEKKINNAIEQFRPVKHLAFPSGNWQ